MRWLIGDAILGFGLMLGSGASVSAAIGWECLFGYIGGCASMLAAGALLSNAGE